ncbi:MAG: redoxin domain-containing protein, partial [Bacteroidetes bacterium]|nr:redoxin domain-containing protein [Bacteroidota bacterium]
MKSKLKLFLSILITSLLLFTVLFAVNQQAVREGSELIGKPAPEWEINTWINSDPLQLKELQGKVVLVRWWMDTCPFCRASSTALNEFH